MMIPRLSLDRFPEVLRRSSSLVNVPASTPPTKKSPPSSRALRLGTAAVDRLVEGCSTTAAWVA